MQCIMYCFNDSIVETNIDEHIITQVHNLKQQSKTSLLDGHSIKYLPFLLSNTLL